jgi:hypothetical protein
MSPIEFVISEKLKCAKQLLKNPTIQINEVCYLSGFEDSNYFIRLFKSMKYYAKTIPAIVCKLDYSIYFNCSSDCSSSGVKSCIQF